MYIAPKYEAEFVFYYVPTLFRVIWAFEKMRPLLHCSISRHWKVLNCSNVDCGLVVMKRHNYLCCYIMGSSYAAFISCGREKYQAGTVVLTTNWPNDVFLGFPFVNWISQWNLKSHQKLNFRKLGSYEEGMARYFQQVSFQEDSNGI